MSKRSQFRQEYREALANRAADYGNKLELADGIFWDELQAIKDGCGYAGRMAVEIYPEQSEQVNAANMRHLWVLPTRLDFAWGGGEKS